MGIMLASSLLALVFFVKSFVDVRRAHVGLASTEASHGGWLQ